MYQTGLLSEKLVGPQRGDKNVLGDVLFSMLRILTEAIFISRPNGARARKTWTVGKTLILKQTGPILMA